MLSTLPLLLFALHVQGEEVQKDTIPVFNLEQITITASREIAATPAANFTLLSENIAARYFGQEVPELLATVPNITTFSDAGNSFGYTYMRMRGVDQSRINVTLDGVPLNEPEDKGVYFSNMPDFMNSISLVNVQPGVGISAFGTPSYIGSVHFQSVNPLDSPRYTELQTSAGSFGTRRSSVEHNTGLLSGNVGAYVRVSTHETDGYRTHSGSTSKSYFMKSGYYGATNQLVATFFGGRSKNDMAYLATSLEDLQEDRRANYLGADEVDDFSQSVLILAYSRDFGSGLVWTSKFFRNELFGNYDVRIDGLWNFNLMSNWTGILNYLQFDRGRLSINSGLNYNDYTRDHWQTIRPSKEPLYTNAGNMEELNSFVRATYTFDHHLSFMFDAQLKTIDFEYTGSVALPRLSWTFFNPRASLSYKPSPTFEAYSFVGRTTREPTRNDLLAGFDDISTYEVGFVGDLNRVKPETVYDFEGGVKLSTEEMTFNANFYLMEFRNEIAPIGQLSYIGLPLRKNVDRSYRRGVELSWNYHLTPAVDLGGNLSASSNRIEQYTDDVSGQSYQNVAPLLTPTMLGMLRIDYRPSFYKFGGEVYFSGPSYLDNTQNDDFSTPSYRFFNLNTSVMFRDCEITLHVRNVFNDNVYLGGYADGITSYYYPLATRNIMVTGRVIL